MNWAMEMDLYHNLDPFTFIQDVWSSIKDIYKQIQQLLFLFKLADTKHRRDILIIVCFIFFSK